MSDMVAVYSDDGRPLGQTFPRRARQLVTKQRAAWADEGQSAIRLAREAEADWDLAEREREAERPGKSARDDAWLYELAKRRVREKRHMLWHTLLLLPGYIMLFWFFDVFAYGTEEALIVGFVWGAWTWAYLTRLYHYLRPRVKGFRFASEEEKIARELERLNRA